MKTTLKTQEQAYLTAKDAIKKTLLEKLRLVLEKLKTTGETIQSSVSITYQGAEETNSFSNLLTELVHRSLKSRNNLLEVFKEVIALIPKDTIPAVKTDVYYSLKSQFTEEIINTYFEKAEIIEALKPETPLKVYNQELSLINLEEYYLLLNSNLEETEILSTNRKEVYDKLDTYIQEKYSGVTEAVHEMETQIKEKNKIYLIYLCILSR